MTFHEASGACSCAHGSASRAVPPLTAVSSRALLLTASVSIPLTPAPGQLILGLVICFITACVYCSYQQYADPGDNLLSIVCQV